MRIIPLSQNPFIEARAERIRSDYYDMQQDGKCPKCKARLVALQGREGPGYYCCCPGRETGHERPSRAA
jgi:ssDNA-binding Zn-finger/Zn-ribbon topoisomerase 1